VAEPRYSRRLVIALVCVQMATIAALVAIVAARKDEPTQTPGAVTAEPPPTPTVAPAEPPRQPPKVETVNVLVAGRGLPVGTMFTDEDFAGMVATRAVPRDSAADDAVTAAEGLKGRRILRPLSEGEPIRQRDLSRATDGRLAIPAEKRVATAKVAPSAGFEVPGSYVDVLATRRVGKKLVAFPLLVNVQILAVDTTVTPGETGPSHLTVSFAVEQKQALLLQLARSRECQLSLLPRSGSDVKDGDKSYDIDAVIRMLSEME
jgi:Flp pilus assembly protein CpaB